MADTSVVTNKIRWPMVIKLGGSYCAFMIGAGFATGQEISQYFTSYGFVLSICGFIVSLVLGFWTQAAVMDVGYDTDDIEGRNVYANLCGKYLGIALSIFIPIFMFLTFVIMIAGCGATFEQHFGINAWVGSGILVVLSTFVVFLGLARVIDTIGFMGPLIIVICSILGFIVLVTHPFNIAESDAFIASKDMYQASSSVFLSAILYVLWGIVMGLPFMSAMGSRAQNKKEIVWGALVGNVLFNIALALISFAMASQIEFVYDKSIPALAMADSISYGFGFVYSLILLIAIFTTAVPLQWTVASRISSEGSKWYFIAIIVLAILGFFGGQLPFEMLINYIYPLIGYLGFFVLAMIIWRQFNQIRNYYGKKKAIEEGSGKTQ